MLGSWCLYGCSEVLDAETYCFGDGWARGDH
jgi:hypothetical protein